MTVLFAMACYTHMLLYHYLNDCYEYYACFNNHMVIYLYNIVCMCACVTVTVYACDCTYMHEWGVYVYMYM